MMIPKKIEIVKQNANERSIEVFFFKLKLYELT